MALPKMVSNDDGIWDSGRAPVQKIKNPDGKNALSGVGSNSANVQDGGTAPYISTITSGSLSGGQPVGGPNSPSPDQNLISTL